MKKIIGFLFAGVLAIGLCDSAKAAFLAQWTFETSVPATSGPHAAELGVYAATSNATSNTGGTFSNPVGNGSFESFSSNGWNVGEYFQFQTSTLGYEDITVSFDQTGSNTGPRDFTFSYSTDGTNFSTPVAYAALTNDSWTSSVSLTPPISPNPASFRSFNLAAFSSLDNQASVYFRLVNSSTTSIGGGTVATTGTGRVDNFFVSGTAIAAVVPEPATISMFASVGVVGALVRFRRRSKNSAS